MQKHWVFAYGSNMHVADLKRWMKEHDHCTDSIKDAQPAQMADHCLAWNYYSAARRGGAANVVFQSGATLYGVALLVSDPGLAALDQKEGHPQRYHRGAAPQVAHLRSGFEVPAWLYRVLPAYEKSAPVWPLASYMELLLAGARHFELPADYVAELALVPTKP